MVVFHKDIIMQELNKYQFNISEEEEDELDLDDE
jgi:hypothetical protein